MHTLDCDKWYAAFVKTGEEDDVKERLLYRTRGSDIRVVVPKRRLRERRNGIWETKVRTLFPGYVLLNGEIGTQEYYALKDVPGLYRLLCDPSGLLQVDCSEIRTISRLICNREIIEPSHAYLQGGRVVVTDGPLLGMEGLIEAIDPRKGRVKVRLNFIGEPRLVDLSVTLVQTA